MATNTRRNRSPRNHVYRSQAVEDMIQMQESNGYDPTVLGKGASATVYLGKLRGSGTIVAVKRIERTSSLGREAEQFQNEVDILEQVNHANLVKLYGHCVEPGNQALIYEFADEGTLNDHLHGERGKLLWKQCLRIVTESARGLNYLHEDCNPTIYHRDIKSTNILLFTNPSSGEMVAKVADFGISKNLGSHHAAFENSDRTHISTIVAGTFGYLDPEYVSTGHLRDKSDTYSFGVVLLEVITGRKALNLVPWVTQQNPDNLPDEFFAGKYDHEAMTKVINVAKACVQLSSTGRPSMKEVLRTLESAYERETADIGAKSKRARVRAWCARKLGSLGIQWKN